MSSPYFSFLPSLARSCEGFCQLRGMVKKAHVLLIACVVFASTPAMALQCIHAVPEAVVAAREESARQSEIFDCRLEGERALSLGGDLVSTLDRARGYLSATFIGANGRALLREQRGPWLGRFDGLALDETLPVPAGATRVRVVANVQSARSDAGGKWQVTGANLGPGLIAILEAPDGVVVTSGKSTRWVVQTGPSSPAASVLIEVLSLEGAVLQQSTLAIPAGGGRAEVTWPAFQSGYYDIRAKVSASGVRGPTLQSALAVLPGGVAPNELRFGMDAALSWYGGSSQQIEHSLAMMRQAGIGSVRDRLRWSDVQPSMGPPQWGHYAEVAAAVAGAGMDGVQMFSRSPVWARGGVKDPPDYQPASDEVTYDFGRAFAKGLGKWVRNIEYWNEPNVNTFYGYPYQYASGLKAFSAGVKSVDPAIRVLVAAAANKPGSFFEEIYRNNVDGFFDARNQHYYLDDDIVGFVDTYVAGLEQRNGVAARPGWLTEMGYSLKRDVRGEWRHAEKNQAEYLVKTYVGGLAAGYERVFFFFWRELIEAELHTWGIVREDFTPRPAYVALGVLTRHLAGATLVAFDKHNRRMTAYFRHPNGSLSAVTWGGGDVTRFGIAARAKDIYGRTLDLRKGLPADGKPVLLSNIAKLPNSVRIVVTHTGEPQPEAKLRVSAVLTVADQPVVPVVPTSINREAVSVGKGETVVLSGRVFAPAALADGGPLRVQCSAGKGLTPLAQMSPPVATLGKNGAPFDCRFKATHFLTGKSYIAVSVEHGGERDSARVALALDWGG